VPTGAHTDRETIGGEAGGAAEPDLPDRETIGARTDRETVGERTHDPSENPQIAGIENVANSGIPGTELVVLPAVPPAEGTEEVKPPTHSVRGTAPGLRGCWALNKQQQPCGAARRADGDYCNAHSGYSAIAEDPAKWSAIGSAKSAENRRRRATLRLALGHTRLSTPRGVLKASAFAQAEAIAAAALSPISDPSASSMQRHSAALALLREVEPEAQVTVTTSLPATPEGVKELSLSALLSIAQEHGLPLPEASSALIEGRNEG
jgi:hypothetical protein